MVCMVFDNPPCSPKPKTCWLAPANTFLVLASCSLQTGVLVCSVQFSVHSLPITAVTDHYDQCWCSDFTSSLLQVYLVCVILCFFADRSVSPCLFLCYLVCETRSQISESRQFVLSELREPRVVGSILLTWYSWDSNPGMHTCDVVVSQMSYH